MREIEYYQKKLKLSSSLMSIHPQIQAGSNEEFLLELLKAPYEDREEKERFEI